MLLVQPRWSQDIDKIRLEFARKQCVEALEMASRGRELLSPSLRPCCVGIAERDDLNLGDAPPGPEVVFGDHAAAEDGAAQSNHFNSPAAVESGTESSLP